MRLLALVLLVAQPQPPGPPTPAQRLDPAEGPAGWRERFDEFWKVRDQPGAE
jgi:hypothetical protein